MAMAISATTTGIAIKKNPSRKAMLTVRITLIIASHRMISNGRTF